MSLQSVCRHYVLKKSRRNGPNIELQRGRSRSMLPIEVSSKVCRFFYMWRHGILPNTGAHWPRGATGPHLQVCMGRYRVKSYVARPPHDFTTSTSHSSVPQHHFCVLFVTKQTLQTWHYKEVTYDLRMYPFPRGLPSTSPVSTRLILYHDALHTGQTSSFLYSSP